MRRSLSLLFTLFLLTARAASAATLLETAESCDRDAGWTVGLGWHLGALLTLASDQHIAQVKSTLFDQGHSGGASIYLFPADPVTGLPTSWSDRDAIAISPLKIAKPPLDSAAEFDLDLPAGSYAVVIYSASGYFT